MKMIQIPKRSGGTRTICVPSSLRKNRCRELIPQLQELVRKHCNMDVVHGFAELRSPVTNAQRHIGYKYTISFDLRDFFDHVTPNVGDAQKVAPTQLLKYKKVSTAYFWAWHNGVARQGLPTSPIIANLAATVLDRSILGMLKAIGQCVYTRYADDLTISCNTLDDLKFIREQVPTFVAANNFALNERKTTIQSANAGRRIVTGVAVDETGLHPTRAAKRRLRAAQHNAETGRVKHFPKRQWTRHVKVRRFHGSEPMPQAMWIGRWLKQRVAGLVEWCRLKPPSYGRRSAGRISDVQTGVKALVSIANRGDVT